ncbi:THAP domain-containing protein 3-like isoform X2 [Chelonus insularis]|uniref:THAP domain-containing protein 3-like isoform X2 n=1 Tax=Chelonus insularis TaxID=460826 RepID=UPI0015892EB2|nr:THAP domain-containing protein 3-like isoform X2 [Chelonus insularis]
MRSCVYCKKTSVPGDKRSFHTFPMNERLKSIWIRNMGKTNWSPSKHTLLCSDHFTPNCIDFRDCRPRLRKGSIPTIFDHELDISISLIDNIIKENKTTSLTTQANSLRVNTSLTAEGINKNSSSVDQPFSELEIQSPPRLSNLKNSVSDGKLTSNTSIKTTEGILKISPSAMEIKHCKETAEHDHYYTNSPSEVQLKLRATQHKVMVLTKEKKVLAQKVKRMQETIKSLKEAVKKLRAYRGVDDDDFSSFR